HQLGERERLRDVVVAAGLEAREAVDERVARRQEEDRRLNPARPERLADVTAVRVRQSDVDDQRVGRRLLDAGEKLRARADGVGREALLGEAAPEHGPELEVVLDDQDARAMHRPGSMAARRWALFLAKDPAERK